MWVESKRSAAFLKRFMLQMYSFIQVLSFGGMNKFNVFVFVCFLESEKALQTEHLLFLQLCDRLLSFSIHFEKSCVQVRNYWLREVKSLA